MQIRILATQAPSASYGLLKCCMNALIFLNSVEQSLAIRAAQLFNLSIFKKRVNEFRPFITKLFQSCGIGAEPCFCFLTRSELALFVQHFLQLCWRVEINRTTHHSEQFLAQRTRPTNEIVIDFGEGRHVDPDTQCLHFCQDSNKWMFNVFIQQQHS